MRLTHALAIAAFAFTNVVHAQSAPSPRVEFTTSAGPIVVELDEQKAPNTVKNFLQYVREGHYDGTTFHRVIPTFMIQGGGFTKDMTQKPTRAPIKIESSNGLKNVRGSIAMARTANADSATSQFFINVTDNAMLDYPGRDGYGYTVFGKVVSGMDTVEKIRRVPTTSKGMHQDVPETPVVIEKAVVLNAASAK